METENLNQNPDSPENMNAQANTANQSAGPAQGAGFYAGNGYHIGNTRANCPLQNPYYQNMTQPTMAPGINPGIAPNVSPAAANPYIQNPSDAAINGTNNPPSANTSGGFNTGDFVKGALIGAAATYLMTNKNVQDALFKTVAKTSNLFQMGMEEVKERFEDAKAEVQAQNNGDM